MNTLHINPPAVRFGWLSVLIIALAAWLVAWPSVTRAATPQIVSADGTNCLLRQDGSVSCWGYDENGQASPPPGPFEQISLGGWSGCGLRASGQVECWGAQGGGLLEVPEGSYTQVGAGDNFHCAVRAGDQKVVCWGTQLGGTYIPYTGEEDDFIKVSAGYQAFCAIRTNGALECGGFFAPLPPEGTFTDVVADKNRSQTFCAVRSDGQVLCWGYELYGQTQTPAGSFVTASLGAYHACGLRTDGTISCWGYFGNQDYRQYFPPAGQYTSLGVGFMHNCALRIDGAVVCWGINNWGEAPRLAIEPDAVTAAEVDVPYAASLSMVDKGKTWTVTPYVPVDPILAIVSGELPAGIALAASGQLQGTATVPGVWPLTVLAQDANGYEIERNLAFTVVPQGQDVTPPLIAPDVSGTNETSDWYRSDVTVEWSVTDPDSTVAATSGCDTIVLTQDTPRPGTSFACTATSTGGTSTHVLELRRDATAPTVQVTAVEPLPDGLFTVRFTASDVVSDVAFVECALDDGPFAFCDSWTYDTVGPLSEGPHTFRVRAVDNANNYGIPLAHPINFAPDTTAPVIVPELSGTLGNAGWYVSDVTLTWSVTDPESSITASNGCGEAIITSDTVGTTYTCQATSAGGSSQQSITVKRDATTPDTEFGTLPPNPSSDPTATFGFAGLELGSGIAGFGCSLDGAPFASCLPPVTLTDLTAGAHTFAVRAVDAAGNIDPSPASYTWTVQLQADAIAPVANPRLSKAPNQFGWHTQDVTVTWNWSDAGSGIDSAQCDRRQTTTGEGVITLTATCRDLAGNVGTASVEVRVDKSTPFFAPAFSSLPILLNASTTVAANATDNASGIASQTCGPVITTAVGKFTLTCTATNGAGLASTIKLAYTVIYGIAAFNPPVGMPPTVNLVRQGQVIPLRWRLVDASGAPVTTLRDATFSVFSDDVPASSCAGGIPQTITATIPAQSKFVHLGGGNYEHPLSVDKKWPVGLCLRVSLVPYFEQKAVLIQVQAP